MKVAIQSYAQLDPKYEGNQHIKKVDVVQGGEGPVSHMHVTMRDGSVSYVRLDVAEYTPHHKDGHILNSKERRELVRFLSKIEPRRYVQSFNTDDVRKATNYESAVDYWVSTYGHEDKFVLDADGFPVMPDYSELR